MGRDASCGENFRLVPIYKNFCGAHTLVAKVVANMSPWGKLRTTVRPNLLIQFGAHFYVLLRKSMKWCGVTHCTLINLVSIFSKNHRLSENNNSQRRINEVYYLC